MFDRYPRNGTQWFIGEYAGTGYRCFVPVGVLTCPVAPLVISTNVSDASGVPAGHKLHFPTIEGSVAEAAYLTGLERNSDVVFALLYHSVYCG